MKLIIFLLLLASQAFAQGGGDRVGGGQIIIPMASVSNSLNWTKDVEGSYRTTLNSNGSVSKVVIHNGEPRRAVLPTNIGAPEIYECVDTVGQFGLKVSANPTCETIYYTSRTERIFAVRECGKLRTIKHPCAKKLLNLLDDLNVLF